MRINIEIGDIEAFIELTETNSFAKAAEGDDDCLYSSGIPCLFNDDSSEDQVSNKKSI